MKKPLIAAAMEAQWTYTQRVMGEVLMRDELPRDIWDQHEAMLDAVMAGDGAAAEALARQHITQAAAVMISRLRERSGSHIVVMIVGGCILALPFTILSYYLSLSLFVKIRKKRSEKHILS